MPLQAITSREPISGYQIRERIGAGGYGEVWRADAPGGLTKAIKFVYGYLDEDRASRELKALSRIKSVRHPFLLSLERIEVVDGQLLIVTELAECSLKDRFDECRREGLPGIPRDELLQYLQDAADVLDYMSKNHSLQHLDVKPENLLVLAGRIKVADFGLVKDLHDLTASLMGGLTPLYAPPEVFDGRPTQWSDQYSLAIVFQEMLTGELPFPGTTAMQLAQQHMNAAPRVAALSERDQAVVRHALAKIPDQRFPDCRTLLNELHAAGLAGGTAPASSPLPTATAASSQGPARMVTTEQPAAAGGRRPAGPTIHVPRIRTAPAVTSLPPLEQPAEPVAARPTVYVGMGGTGSRILLGLQKRIADRLGPVSHVPALQMLLLDTDVKELVHVSRRQSGLGMDANQLLSLPLRKSQDYRKLQSRLLGWLSRRWLYNIPKSLQTEGLRPLGRLALIDHLSEVRQRLDLALQTAISEEALARSRDTIDRPFDGSAPQIVLVASLSGGTGSGMVLDLGYLVQELLSQRDLPRGEVVALLTHSTGRTARWKELAAVNTYAALSELNRFSRPGSIFPGGSDDVVSQNVRSTPPFHSTYVVHLGEDLNEAKYAESADQFAEYMFLSTATHADGFFRGCRQTDAASSPAPDVKVRTCGLKRFSCLQDDLVSAAIEHLSRHVLERRLLGDQCPAKESLGDPQRATMSVSALKPQTPDYARLAPGVEELIATEHFDAQQLINHTVQGTVDELGGPIDAFLQRQLEPILGHSPQNLAGYTRTVALWSETLDRLVGSADPLGCRESDRGILEMAVAPHRKKTAVQISDAVRKLVYAKVDDETTGVQGAAWLTQRFLQYTKTLSAEVAERWKCTQAQHAQASSALHGRVQSVARSDQNAGRQVTDGLLVLGRSRLDCFILETVVAILRSLEGHISAIADELTDLSRQLRQLIEQFDLSVSPGGASAHAATREVDYHLQEFATQYILQNFADMARQIDRQLEAELQDARYGWSAFLRNGGDKLNRLPERLRAHARMTLLSAMKQSNVAETLFDDNQHPDHQVKTLHECLNTARPRLLACGGAKRLLVILPQNSTQTRPLEILQSELEEVPSVVRADQADYTFCYEVEQVSLTQIAVTLIDERPDYVDFAGRVHTRKDITWSPLPDLA